MTYTSQNALHVEIATLTRRLATAEQTIQAAADREVGLVGACVEVEEVGGAFRYSCLLCGGDGTSTVDIHTTNCPLSTPSALGQAVRVKIERLERELAISRNANDSYVEIYEKDRTEQSAMIAALGDLMERAKTYLRSNSDTGIVDLTDGQRQGAHLLWRDIDTAVADLRNQRKEADDD